MSSKEYSKMKEDNIIKSVRGIKRAEPNPFLFTRIDAKLNEEVKKIHSLDWLTRLAFCVSIFIIFINVISIATPSHENQVAVSEEVGIDEFATDSLLYTSIVQNFNFYENESN